jgi:sulfite exporter TauE/SafE
MQNDILLLTLTAASLGFVHTVLGPDHYLPFIFMSRARQWSWRKTFWVTGLSGLGHVGSSIVLGAIGIAAGYGLSKVEGIESMRGDWAAWAFVLFGFIYMLYGIWRAVYRKPHTHVHIHEDGEVHEHNHVHGNGHDHVHNKKLTPWVLFLIFVLGPCEPLIPLLMYPASENSPFTVAAVAIVFSVVTIGTMLAVTFLGIKGLSFVHVKKLERWMHALAGGIVLLSGVLILVGL